MRTLMATTIALGVMAPSYALADGAHSNVLRDSAEDEMTRDFIVLVDGEVKVEDVVADVEEVYAAVVAYRAAGDNATKLAALLLLLAVIFKACLSGAKLAAKEYFTNRRGKTVLRVTTLVLGLGVLVITRVMAGMTWVEASFLALSGPGSIVVHEMTALFSGMKDDKDVGAG